MKSIIIRLKHSVKASKKKKKEETILYIHILLLKDKVKYKLKSNTKCTEKLVFLFVCEQKVVFTL